ncbi:MAG: bifunctional folylpolyglutamate synthase/dihydrofolate synthase [Bacteroidales bacterium]|nr:bifunctional folylpolyglutamate synthase/dihydrofolate synthase [Bacteroidales bacterium]
MTYQDTIGWLYEQLPMFQRLGAGAYKPGLGTSQALDDAFGNPHRRFKTIHVAGTNGKGSVSHSIASVLMAAGYRVGLYTSPHLFDFRERIRINGQKITEAAVTDFVERYQRLGLDCSPSFFELTTIMAFDYFAQQGGDFAVIEVGLGGRLDTTNIITPELCVITNVSLDHTELLGDTLAQIAGEKAGIIKPGIPVVIGETTPETRPVYARKAEEVGAPITWAEESPRSVPCDLQGEWQGRNVNTALHALDILFRDVLPTPLPSGLTADEAIALGMADVAGRTGLMGRWTKLQDNPTVICDTGHNLGAWQYLAPRLARIAQELGERGATLRVVLGFANDKDVEHIFPMLPRDAEYYFVQPDVKRARPSASLLALAQSHALTGRDCGPVLTGYHQALAASIPTDTIFVGGSNFVIAELPVG